MSKPTKAELIERYGEPDDFACDASGPDNLDRADWALAAVQAFYDSTHYDGGQLTMDDISDPDAVGELVGDLVGDLFHLLTLCGHEPDEIIAAGMTHFTAEVGMGYGEDDEDDAASDILEMFTDELTSSPETILEQGDAR